MNALTTYLHELESSDFGRFFQQVGYLPSADKGRGSQYHKEDKPDKGFQQGAVRLFSF